MFRSPRKELDSVVAISSTASFCTDLNFSEGLSSNLKSFWQYCTWLITRYYFSPEQLLTSFISDHTSQSTCTRILSFEGVSRFNSRFLVESRPPWAEAGCHNGLWNMRQWKCVQNRFLLVHAQKARSWTTAARWRSLSVVHDQPGKRLELKN